MSNIPKAVWSGSFNVFGVDVRCHTLEDGTRIIEKESLFELFDAMGSDDCDKSLGDMSSFCAWQKGGA